MNHTHYQVILREIITSLNVNCYSMLNAELKSASVGQCSYNWTIIMYITTIHLAEVH